MLELEQLQQSRTSLTTNELLSASQYMRSLMTETPGASENRKGRNELVMNTHLSGGKSESKSLAENGTQRNAVGIGVDLASSLPDIADEYY